MIREHADVPISFDTCYPPQSYLRNRAFWTRASASLPVSPHTLRFTDREPATLPHSSSARYHLPNLHSSQPYSYFQCPYALQSFIFSPDPRQANDTQLCNHGLRSHCFTFQPTKPQWQDASSSSSWNFLGRVLGRRLCSCYYCPSSRPGVRIPRLSNWRIRC